MIPIDLRLSAKSDYNWLGVSCGWRDEGLDPTVNCLHGHSIIFNVAKWSRREEVIGYDVEEREEEDEVVNPLFPGLCPSLFCSLWTESFVDCGGDCACSWHQEISNGVEIKETAHSTVQLSTCPFSWITPEIRKVYHHNYILFGDKVMPTSHPPSV